MGETSNLNWFYSRISESTASFRWKVWRSFLSPKGKQSYYVNFVWREKWWYNPSLPNTSWEGVLGMFLGPVIPLRQVLGSLGQMDRLVSKNYPKSSKIVWENERGKYYDLGPLWDWNLGWGIIVPALLSFSCRDCCRQTGVVTWNKPVLGAVTGKLELLKALRKKKEGTIRRTIIRWGGSLSLAAPSMVLLWWGSLEKK